MPGHQYPPDVGQLRRKGPDTHALTQGTVLWRIHFTGSPRPTAWNGMRTWGPVPTSRWDPHPQPAGDYAPLGVAYLGESVDTCLGEVFQLSRFVDADRHTPYVTAISTACDVELADLTGPWLTRAGASAQVAMQQKARTRAWARAIHEAWPKLDGVIAPSAMVGGRRVIALWNDRAMPSSPEFSIPLNSPAIAADIANAARSIGFHSNIVL